MELEADKSGPKACWTAEACVDAAWACQAAAVALMRGTSMMTECAPRSYNYPRYENAPQA
jgi:hypothetical protein